MKVVYLATNGESDEWNCSAIFATRKEAERYVALFAFADTVEVWGLGVPDMPMDAAIKSWSCRYDQRGEVLSCQPVALDHSAIGRTDGHKGKNRGISVYARTEDDARAQAMAIIERRDGPIYGRQETLT